MGQSSAAAFRSAFSAVFSRRKAEGGAGRTGWDLPSPQPPPQPQRVSPLQPQAPRCRLTMGRPGGAGLRSGQGGGGERS